MAIRRNGGFLTNSMKKDRKRISGPSARRIPEIFSDSLFVSVKMICTAL